MQDSTVQRTDQRGDSAVRCEREQTSISDGRAMVTPNYTMYYLAPTASLPHERGRLRNRLHEKNNILAEAVRLKSLTSLDLSSNKIDNSALVLREYVASSRYMLYASTTMTANALLVQPFALCVCIRWKWACPSQPLRTRVSCLGCGVRRLWHGEFLENCVNVGIVALAHS